MPATTPILPSTGRGTTHAAMSHPEAEERHRARYMPTSDDLRQRLDDYRRATGDTNRVLGRKLGFPDGTAVSKYLNDKYDRDPAEIEKRIESLLTGEARRHAIVTEVIQTSVIRQVEGFLDSVKATNTVGVLHSPAGLGKTTGIERYIEKNPTALLLTANAVQNDAKGVRQLLWGAVDHRGYKHGQSRWDHCINKLAGSGRLIVVDNAQRLQRSGRDFLFDFRDATGCPFVLVGNPSILEDVAQIDQQHSRTLMEHRATLKDVKRVAKRIVDQHTEHGEDIYDLAVPVAGKDDGGHLRALVMTLMSMTEFLRDEQLEGDPRRAFESALAKSIHHKSK